jgi:hypothetical protein
MSTRTTSPVGIASFPALFKPVGFAGSPEKYSVTLVFDKDEDLSALKKSVDEAIAKKFGDKIPANITMPVKCGNTKLDKEGNIRPEFKDLKFITASCKAEDKPKVVDGEMNVILDPAAIYGGCEMRIAVNVFAWEHMGKRGVSLYLSNCQKVSDGVAFGANNSVESDFGS